MQSSRKIHQNISTLEFFSLNGTSVKNGKVECACAEYGFEVPALELPFKRLALVGNAGLCVGAKAGKGNACSLSEGPHCEQTSRPWDVSGVVSHQRKKSQGLHTIHRAQVWVRSIEQQELAHHN
jgi:hypothetical protein